ncbi:GDSL-type esterase/lipase family protein [Paenarthrobacter sp. PAE-2]|uniref:GDSL-type esterase/lipase family protein n=1 Tax=Paenarthrobacter sp. PAE-2 TaxID=2982532 RepID=UPI0022324EAF|nr:GDSL-type esterase/lipase family protein [Paenarthrobacter sp. PAE-2]MCW3766485.1 GDSL-type esterase/lipase family protein [Paenarthrobacter sp. PAE-2]
MARIVTVGDDLTLPAPVKVADGNLPARLQDGALNATYGPTADPMKSAFASKKDVRSLAVTPLRWFRNQVGGVASAPVDILFVGDSTMEGARAATRATRWIDQVVAKLRAKYQPAGVAGGVGYTPAIYTGGVPFGGSQWSYLNALGGSATVYSDTFSRSGDLNGSTPQIGAAWTGTNGQYVLDGAAAVTQTASGGTAYANAGTASDRTVTVNATLGTLTATNQFFILIGMYDPTAPNNKVQLEAVLSNTTSTWRIVKRISNTVTTMATYATPPVPVDASNATFEASIKIEGLTVTATVNGVDLTATLTQPEKDSLAAATFTGFQLPIAGSKLLDYTVTTIGPSEVAVVPVLDAGYGLGLRSVKLGPTGSVGVMRRTFTGTAVDVVTTKRSGGGTIAVKIDGVAKASIDTSNATEVNGFATRYGGLSQGSHVLELVCSSGYAILEGVMEYNQDEASGIRMWDSAHVGYNTVSFTTNVKWANSAKALMVPDMVFIALGLNDYAVQATVPPATYKTNLLAIIGKVREANANASIVLHNSWERGDVAAPTYPWAQYLAAIDEIVAADPTILLVDVNSRLLGWNLVDAAFRDVWDSDKIHLVASGYGAVANAVTAAISD